MVMHRPKKLLEIGFDLVLEIEFHGVGVERGGWVKGTYLYRPKGSTLLTSVQIVVPLLLDFVRDNMNVMGVFYLCFHGGLEEGGDKHARGREGAGGERGCRRQRGKRWGREGGKRRAIGDEIC